MEMLRHQISWSQINRFHVCFACLVATVFCIICYTFVLQDVKPTYENYATGGSDSKRVDRKPNEPKLVLLWTPFFEKPDWLPSTHQLNCSVKNCELTSNRSLANLSSAIVLHWRGIERNELPSREDTSALLVLFNLEAPPHTPLHLISDIKDRIHWTATYRKDSDVYAPYGRVVKGGGDFVVPEKQPTEANSTRSRICWLVSNCATPSGREVYVNKLRKFIDVDVYGKCGNFSCPYPTSRQCYEWLSHRCDFYLSFENSICKDYVTEKLFHALDYGMVPVVMGGDDYALRLPPRSFINARDFSGPMALAEYLKKLSKDEHGYLSYLEWKKHYSVNTLIALWYCDLCEKLHKTDLNEVKPHKDLLQWWYDEAHCEHGL